MDILLIAHSHWRNIVFLATALVLVKYTLGWLMKSKFGKFDRIAGIILTSVADIQTLMGLVLFTLMTIEMGFDRLRMEHAFTNLVGVGLLHLNSKWRNADDATRFRNGLLVTLGFILLILVGISRLPAGLSVLFGKERFLNLSRDAMREASSRKFKKIIALSVKRGKPRFALCTDNSL